MKKKRFAMIMALILALILTNFSGFTVYAENALGAAQKAIFAALNEFPATNETTEDEFYKAVLNAIPDGSPVTFEMYDYKLTPATNQNEGRIAATIVLDDGVSHPFGMPVNAIIPRIKSQNETKLEEDRLAISTAVKKVKVSNATTKEELLKVARGAVKNGTTVEWKSFRKVESTFDTKGSISGYFSTKLNGLDRELRYSVEIAKRVRKIPKKELTAKGRSVNSAEWEVLRQTNIERHKKGLTLLTMVQPLQGVTCVRAKEENDVKSVDHKRADGSSFSTAVPSSFKHGGLGENLFRCKMGSQVDPTMAVNSWINSATHRKNILNSKFNYIGITMGGRMGVQVFAVSKNKITSYTTSTGKKSFNSVAEMEEEYLICKDSSGLKSYLPLDTTYMKKVKGGYTLKLNSGKTIKLTIKESSSSTASFTDVDSEYAEAVAWVTKNKYMTGTSKTEFGPKLSCTRGDVLTYLYYANGSPTPPSLNWFSDVSTTDTFYRPALWAQQQGFVDWGMLRPNEVCLRGEALYFVWLSVGSPKAKKATTFTDFPDWVFYKDAVAWAEEKGIIKNSGDNCFHGDDWPCSRADMASYLYGAYHK